MSDQAALILSKAVIADLESQVARLKGELQQREINPPMGSTAQVHKFTPEGWKTLAELVMGPKLVALGVDLEFLMGEGDKLNANLSELGGVQAELLSPATGGSRPPLLNIEDVMDVLSISAPASDEFALRLALGQLAGAPEFRIDPVHPNPPASKQAQIISSKLLLRPQLAEEVFRLLMVDFT